MIPYWLVINRDGTVETWRQYRLKFSRTTILSDKLCIRSMRNPVKANIHRPVWIWMDDDIIQLFLSCRILDESGSDSEVEDDDSINSCYSSLSDFVSEMRSSGICGEIRENRIYPENQEKTACVEYATVYSPPEELQIPERTNQSNTNHDANPLMSESTISSSSEMNSKLDSPTEERTNLLADPSGNLLDVDSKSSSATITPVAKYFPRPMFEPRVFPSEKDATQVLSPETRRKLPFNGSKPRVSITGHEASTSPSLLEQVGNEINATMAGRVVSNMAKLASDKMSELLGRCCVHTYLCSDELLSTRWNQFPGQSTTIDIVDEPCQSSTTVSLPFSEPQNRKTQFNQIWWASCADQSRQSTARSHATAECRIASHDA